jgi:hypothetical protein
MKAIAVAVTAVFAVTACGQSSESMDHIHTVSVTDGTVLAGAHNGLWQLSEQESPILVSELAWDIMGFAADGPEFFASGHPGPTMDLPANVGLQASRDGGRTWESRALVGEVDFHRLAATGKHVIGIDSQSGAVFFSPDRGESWQTAQVADARDVMIDQDTTIVVGPSRWWLVSPTEIESVEAPLVDVVTAHASPDGLYASTQDGQVWHAVAWRGPWRSVATFDQPATWISADSGSIALLVDGRVVRADRRNYQFVQMQLD